jgi:Ser/Thr protein kinase RdoA (MazF antagonist)
MHFAHHHGGDRRARDGAALNDTPYARLSPDLVLDAVGACGLWPDGRLLALNSYENRVWQVGLEDESPVIAKFYRPGRWSDAAIIEEHTFSHELAAAELPVVAPMPFNGQTLLMARRAFVTALTPRRGGRAPSLESVEQLQWLGRLIARMHVVGARQPFAHRGRLDRDTWCSSRCGRARVVLLPTSLQTNYRAAAERAGCRHRRASGSDRAGAAVAPAWRLPPRQRVVDRRRPALSSTSTTRAPAPRCRICGCSRTTNAR